MEDLCAHMLSYGMLLYVCMAGELIYSAGPCNYVSLGYSFSIPMLMLVWYTHIHARTQLDAYTRHAHTYTSCTYRRYCCYAQANGSGRLADDVGCEKELANHEQAGANTFHLECLVWSL